jgi:DNA-binding CsgD family transcriptional regulator
MDALRVGDRLRAAAEHALVGRRAERDRLRGWVADGDGPVAVFVHGPGGIGKTALLSGTFTGAAVVVDARDVEPTPAALLAHLGALLGSPAAAPPDVAAAIADAGVGVFVLDSYERFAVLDAFVRNHLLPALPASVTTVIAGRNPPNVAWRTSPGWRRLIAELALGPLTAADAAALVRRRVGDKAVVDEACRFGRGHPLALELAAEAIARHPGLDVRGGPPPEVVEELVEVFLEDLGADVREVVEAAAILRRITVPMLAAVLERSDRDVGAAWRAMASLPFTHVLRDGLYLNPVVQDVVAGSVELRDSAGVRALRRRAAAVALAAVGTAPGWAATADLLHLVQNPIVRDAFEPPAGLEHPVEVAGPDDLPAVLAIVRRYAGDEEATLVSRWAAHHPREVVVARGAEGEVRAFSVVVEAAAVHPDLRAVDPVAAAIANDLAARPLRPGGRALINRQGFTADHGDQPSPELAMMIVDLKRTYLELRPDLLRVYAVCRADGPLEATMAALGFSPVGRREVGSCTLEIWALEMSPGSVDAWLARHVELETAPAPARSTPPAGAAAAVATLSPREREVVAALAEGLTNQQLSERLFISERTANRHLSNIFTKLGVRNRTAAARIAIDAGLVG